MSDEPAKPPVNDLKAKMREALDRKKAEQHPGEAHTDRSGKAGHTHGKSGGPSRFQRKSGG